MLVDRHMRHNAAMTANISAVTALHSTGTTGKDDAHNLWCVWPDPGPFIAPYHSLSGAHKQPRASGGPRGDPVLSTNTCTSTDKLLLFRTLGQPIMWEQHSSLGWEQVLSLTSRDPEAGTENTVLTGSFLVLR